MGAFIGIVINGVIAYHIGVDFTASIGWAVFSVLCSLDITTMYLRELIEKR